jgi:membrane-associated protease RseP (regulator of RpoE activity)
VPKKVIVMLGGPVMNLLIGVVLLTILVTVHGVATAQPGAVVATVSPCVTPVTGTDDATTCTDQPKSPALLAGMQPGDRIVSIAGRPIDDTRDVSALIRPQIDQPVPVVLERDGKQLTVTVTPIRNVVPVLDADGVPVVNADGTPQTTEAGYLGVRSAAPVAYVPQSPAAVPGILWSFVSGTAEAIVHVPERMGGVWRAAFSGAEREADSPMSVVGVGRVAGEATGGKYDSLVGESAGDKVWFLVGLLAALNFMLFVFNLIPLLPLDGGHVAGALWEGLKRQIAKLRGRPDPGYVDVAKALPIAYTVSMVLLGASLLLIYADLVKPVNLGG